MEIKTGAARHSYGPIRFRLQPPGRHTSPAAAPPGFFRYSPAMKALLPLLVLLGAAAAARSQTVLVSGEIRERSEFGHQPDRRRFGTTGADDPVHHLRTRLGIAASFREDLRAVVQLQDTRTFGNDRASSGIGAPMFDLRLGYIEAQGIGGTPFGIKVGRQTLSYADERLLGDADWSNDGQTFDAAVIRAETGDLRVDLLGGVLARHPERLLYARDAFLTGIWTVWRPKWLGGSLQAWYLYDDPGSAAVPQERHTPGVYLRASAAGFDLEVSSALQLGEMFGDTTSAYGGIPIRATMIGARLGYTIDSALALRVVAGYDLISGDDPATSSYEAFSTLYPTSHGRHGAIDFFTDIPRDTDEGGLQDIAASISGRPLEGFDIIASVHILSLATIPARYGTGMDNEAPPSRRIGGEIDIEAEYRVAEWLAIGAGYSIFRGAEGRIVPYGENSMQWGYLTATAKF